MRVLILGMNNPGSADPTRALDPSVPRTAGGRLFELVRLERPEHTLDDHMAAFELANMIDSTTWSPTSARRAASRLRGSLTRSGGQTVVALGREVRDLLKVPVDHPWILPVAMGGWTARCLPHPSGLNRWYNGPNERQVAAIMLAELAAAALSAQSAVLEQTPQQ